MAQEKQPPSQRPGEKPQAQPLDFDAINRDMSFRHNVDFNISAGTVTFHPKTNNVLLILNKKYHEDIWQLPKGRKDLGEDIQATAIRETHEETGYLVRLVPARVRTFATRPRGVVRTPGVPGPTALTLQSPRPSLPAMLDTIDDPNTEPVAMVSYPDPQASTGSEVTKLCFFYLASLVDPDAAPDSGTQNPGERLEARWMSVADARRSLRFEAERKALLCAEALWKPLNTAVNEHMQSLKKDSHDEKTIIQQSGQSG